MSNGKNRALIISAVSDWLKLLALIVLCGEAVAIAVIMVVEGDFAKTLAFIGMILLSLFVVIGIFIDRSHHPISQAKPRVALIFKENDEMINVILDRSNCSYHLKRYVGEKMVDERKGDIDPISVRGLGGRYYCKLPIYTQPEMQITLTLTQQDGKKWEVTLDPEEYTLEATPCF